MKKFLILFFTVHLLFLSACGSFGPTAESWEPISDDLVSDGKTGTAPSDAYEKEAASAELPFSSEEATIAYKGTVPVDYTASFGDTVYLSSKSSEEGSCLLKMKIGADTAQKFPIEPPEGMIFSTITTDQNGNLYVAVKNRDNSTRCEIWRIDRTDTVTDRIDISGSMEKDSWVPWALAVAANGDIYLRVGGLDGILALVFDEKGEFLSKITDSDKTYWLIDAMGRGRDGNVYAVLQTSSDQQIIARLDGRNGCIGDVYENILREDAGLYGFVGAGRDCDLLIYGVGGGIYGYDIGSQEAEWNIPVETLPFEAEQIQRIASLSDGRLLFLEQNLVTEDDSLHNTAQGSRFYYIPAEAAIAGAAATDNSKAWEGGVYDQE